MFRAHSIIFSFKNKYSIGKKMSKKFLSRSATIFRSSGKVFFLYTLHENSFLTDQLSSVRNILRIIFERSFEKKTCNSKRSHERNAPMSPGRLPVGRLVYHSRTGCDNAQCYTRAKEACSSHHRPPY